jgi:hypothetical protein
MVIDLSFIYLEIARFLPNEVLLTLGIVTAILLVVLICKNEFVTLTRFDLSLVALAFGTFVIFDLLVVIDSRLEIIATQRHIAMSRVARLFLELSLLHLAAATLVRKRRIETAINGER